MSSAENDTRPVWISEADARLYGGGLLRAWDAAPADPAEAAATALEEAAGRATLNARVVSYREAADAVLAALGAPKATP